MGTILQWTFSALGVGLAVLVVMALVPAAVSFGDWLADELRDRLP